MTPRFTVTARERSLGVWVPIERARVIWARWVALGLHDVRIIKDNGTATPLVSAEEVVARKHAAFNSQRVDVEEMDDVEHREHTRMEGIGDDH